MFNKVNIKQVVLDSIESKLDELQSQLSELQQGLGNNAKSTAGDKHETGRAMLHLEQEQLGKQIEPLLKMRSVMKQLDCEGVETIIKPGSLVISTSGTYFLSVGIGQITIDDHKIFCLSPGSPLGQILIGLKKGDSFQYMGETHIVNELV